MSEQEQNREQRTDVLLRFLEGMKRIDALGGKPIQEVLKDEEHTRAFLQKLDDNQFLDLLNGTNGILRGRRSKDWKSDWERVDLTGFSDHILFPRTKDKPELLKTVRARMSRMLQQGRSLADIATLVSTSLVAIHPFGDGNGRTSRLIHEMIERGTQTGWRERLKILLSEDGRWEHDAAPSVQVTNSIKKLILQEMHADQLKVGDKRVHVLFSEHPPSQLPFPEGLNPEEATLFIDAYKHDDRLIFTAVVETLRNAGTFNDFLKEFEEHTAIDLDKLLPILSVKDVQSILDIYGHLKVRQVELLMDSIENPDALK